MKPRVAQPHDAPFILDIDTKNFEYYWTPDQWAQVWDAHGICILVLGEPPVGFCVMVEGMLYGEKVLHIPKLAVREGSRGAGFGKQFLATVYRYCQEEGTERIAASLPLTKTFECCWLREFGFEAVRMEHDLLYCQEEDIILFTRSVECLPQHKVL